MTILTSDQWDSFIVQNPDAHLLQTTSWGRLKEQFGWSVVRISTGELGAQILFRSLSPGVNIAYIPKGPVGLSRPDMPEFAQFCKEADLICKKRHAFLLKIEPDAWRSESPLEMQALYDHPLVEPIFDDSRLPNMRISQHSIQPLRTILVNLEEGEEQILSRMKQKTRYNIRLAQRLEVKVTPSNDLNLFYDMIQETGARDRFGVHNLDYYRRCYELFQPSGQCELFLASYQEEPLAMLMVFSQGRRAWYFYGASRNIHREKMPTYLLQWEAMRWARARGCKTYDLWGVPDENPENLEAKFATRHDGLWGVYRFKRGFGGLLLRAAGPWDRIYNPILYHAYGYWIKRTRQGAIGE